MVKGGCTLSPWCLFSFFGREGFVARFAKQAYMITCAYPWQI
jgi:hypothetical protein